MVGLTVQVTVAEGAEPAIGSQVGVVHQRERSLLYDAGSGELVSRRVNDGELVQSPSRMTKGQAPGELAVT